MSNSAGWMNVGGVTVVGTASITAADDLLTITSHGLADGDLVMVDTLSGGGAELREGSTYVVRSPTADTFQLSTPSGNTVFDFTADGSARVLTAVPSYAAVDLRRLETIQLHPGSADRLGAREGVRPHSSDPVTVSGTTWTAAEGVAVVYPAETTTSGPYTVTYDATSAALDPADGTNPRLDGIDLQVQDDDEDGSGQRRARIVYVAGTPASSPSAPAVTTNALRLATILVPAGGSPSPSVDSLAPYAIGAAPLPVRGTSERPTAGSYQGVMVYRQDTDELEVWDGSSWETLASLSSPRGIVADAGTILSSAHIGSTEAVVTEDGSGDPYSLTFTAEAGRTYRVEFTCEMVDKDNAGTDDDANFGSKGSAMVRLRSAAGSTISTSSTVRAQRSVPVFDNNSDRADGFSLSTHFTPLAGQTTVGLTMVARQTTSAIRLLRLAGSPMNQLTVTDVGPAL